MFFNYGKLFLLIANINPNPRPGSGPGGPGSPHDPHQGMGKPLIYVLGIRFKIAILQIINTF
jgi:hypothetical protein